MTIKYILYDGTKLDVDVTEEVGAFILESRHKEKLNDRRHNSHKISISSFIYEDEKYFGYSDDYSIFCSDILESFRLLTEIEYKRLNYYINGYTMEEIAELYGVSVKQVSKSINNARKKIKDYLNRS